jgi:hypothetical protein
MPAALLGADALGELALGPLELDGEAGGRRPLDGEVEQPERAHVRHAERGDELSARLQLGRHAGRLRLHRAAHGERRRDDEEQAGADERERDEAHGPQQVVDLSLAHAHRGDGGADEHQASEPKRRQPAQSCPQPAQPRAHSGPNCWP